MTGVEYERESCIFVSWTFCVQFTVYCEEYEFRYWYNHSVETFQILNDNKRFIEWWKGHITQHLTGKAPYDGNDELYWEMDLYRNDELSWELDLFGNARGKIAMD